LHRCQPSYANIADRYIHQFIDHATRYVAGKVHVNGLENFWSLVKRMIKGTYVHVAPFHLQRYLDEEVWRFNERKKNDGWRFATVMRGVVGKRMTYRQLCAIGDCGSWALSKETKNVRARQATVRRQSVRRPDAQIGRRFQSRSSLPLRSGTKSGKSNGRKMSEVIGRYRLCSKRLK